MTPRVISDPPPEFVILAKELANFPSDLDPCERADLEMLILASCVTLAQGSTRMPLPSAPGGPFAETIASLMERKDHAQVVADRIADLLRGGRCKEIIGVPGEIKPLIVEGAYLYHEKMRRLEKAFVEHFAARLEGETEASALKTETIERALLDVLDHAPVLHGAPLVLSKEQQCAVLAAVHSRTALVLGGPGTGKTSIVVTMLRLIVRLGISAGSIALAAPTGKAAQRMGASIGRTLKAVSEPSAEDLQLITDLKPPETLHRLLSYSPAQHRFGRHENHPLAAAVVIVDECSMIDLWLMRGLVAAVRPGARLVLLGDPDQIPSVSPGAVLRDLVPKTADRGPLLEHWRSERALAKSTVRLTRSYRMNPSDPEGSAIHALAERIQSGDGGVFLESRRGSSPLKRRRSAAELQFSGVEILLGSEHTPEFLKRWVRERIALGRDREHDRRVQKIYRFGPGGSAPEDAGDLEQLFSHFDRFKILCLTRSASHPSGAIAVNDAITRHMGAGFSPGTPIMVEHNDYERALFNGDQGLVLRVEFGDGASELALVFRNHVQAFTALRLASMRSEVCLAHAVTVHKAQGSEFDDTAIFLPDEEMPLLTREVLYTAVSRSRRSVVFIGSEEMLARAALRTVTRHSGIRERLEAALRAR